MEKKLIPENLQGSSNKHRSLTFMLSNSANKLLKVVGEIYEKCDE